MNPVTFLVGYIRWHYGIGIGHMLRVYGNFLWFVQHYFSIPTLLKTLFSPWKRLHEDYRGDFFGSLLVNTLMRIIGAVARIFLIVIGLVFFAIVLVLGFIFFLFWFVAPVAIPLIFIYGLNILGVF